MFYLLFGIMWTIFSSFFFVGIILSGINSNPNGEVGYIFNTEMIIPIIFISVFLIIGIIITIKGIKQIIKDIKTSKYGLPCYGIIQDIKNTGSYVNGNPEYKAILDVVNPNTFQVEKMEEIIGFDYNKYPIHSYVLCKYYEGDINFENKIEANTIPSTYKDLLKPINYKSELTLPYQDLEFSEDRQYVTIDGITYKRIN